MNDNANDPNAAAQQAAIAKIDLEAQGFMGPAIICLINGCIRSLPQYPIDRLMITVAGLFGKAMGLVLNQGDLGPLMRLRRQCVDTFESEMKKERITPSLPPGAVASALPPETKELLNKLKMN